MPADEHDDQPWQPIPGENNRWYSRFAQYLALGAARSVRAVYNAERGNAKSHAVPASWTQASHRFEWQRRAAAYDADQRRQLFARGNAADTEQVRKLDDIAQRLYDRSLTMLEAMPGLEDGKFNDKVVAQFIAVLDALAKRTGSLAPQRIEHTGKGGGAIQVDVEEEATMRVFVYVPQVGHIDEASIDNGALPGDTTQLLDDGGNTG